MRSNKQAMLKPCPFCGAKLHKMSEQQGYFHPIGNCTLSDYHMEADGYSEERWNTRAQSGEKTDPEAWMYERNDGHYRFVQKDRWDTPLGKGPLGYVETPLFAATSAPEDKP